jgi:protein XRP2
MGCGSSAGPKPAPAAGKKAAPVKSEEKKRKSNLNKADYVLSKRNGEVIVKEAGTIGGEQFCVEDCKDCDIFLMDHIACVFVDECEGCRIFIGPTMSSVMIRNCKSMSCVIACQQFRTRDCTDCKFSLLCTTEPIIETSTQMQFACFEFNYFSLRAQLSEAQLNVWNNKWWMVYDFNKNSEKPNWNLLPKEEVQTLLRPDRCTSLAEEELNQERAVPVTLGSREWPSAETCFMIFLPGADAYIGTVLTKVEATEGWELCRARSTLLEVDRLKSLLSWTKESKLPGQCQGKELTGAQICGPGICEQMPEVLSSTGLEAGSKLIRIVPSAQAAALAKAFFEVWKDEI